MVVAAVVVDHEAAVTVAFRKMLAIDRRFVLDSWSTSYRLSHAAGLIQMGDWSRIMDEQIAKVLDKPGVVTWIAYETDVTSDVAIYGFLTLDPGGYNANDAVGKLTHFDQPYVFFCYVKKDYRRRGIARALFRAAGIDPMAPFVFACRVELLRRLERVIPQARWNPLPGRFPKEIR